MSHEIRTPLNGVVSMADSLIRRTLGKQEREMVELIRSSGVTLERLLSDILDSARIESGQVTIEPVPFDLEQAVADIGALPQAKAEDKGVALEVGFDPALSGLVEGDAVRLRQVLTNLLGNAAKFTEKGRVRLEARPVAATGAGLRVRFAVTDTGPGIAPEHLPRLFKRFSQLEAGARDSQGTGIGLFISKTIVEAHGGSITVQSRPGRGTLFTVWLPKAQLERRQVPA